MTHCQREEEIERGCEEECEEEKEGSPVPIFPPLRFRIVRIFPSSVGFCSQVSGKNWFNRSKTSTYSYREEKIERGYEEERENSLVPIFPPLNFEIVKLSTD